MGQAANAPSTSRPDATTAPAFTELRPAASSEAAAPAWLRDMILAEVPPLRRRQAVASVDAKLYRQGAAISIDGRTTRMRREAYLGFIDLSPGNSWPHDCLYVLCDAFRRTVRVRQGRSPPRLGEGRRLLVIARGEDVAPWGAVPPYRE